MATKLSKNFTLEEITNSSTAQVNKITNKPNQEAIDNIKELVKRLQVIRDAWGEPIIISSGYRCQQLNKLLKGAANSDHLYGAAADIHTKTDKPEDNKRLFDLIVLLIKQGKLTNIRQCIDEYKYNWVHVSINHNRNSYKNSQILHLG